VTVKHPRRLMTNLSEETAHWLAERAHRNRRSVSAETRALLEGMQIAETPIQNAEMIAPPSVRSRHVEAPRGGVWDFGCKDRRLHRAGVVCEACGGSGPR